MSEPSVPRQVLIVEDDAKVRGALREVFIADGYQCRVAANGREGLDVFQRERPPLDADRHQDARDGRARIPQARAGRRRRRRRSSSSPAWATSRPPSKASSAGRTTSSSSPSTSRRSSSPPSGRSSGASSSSSGASTTRCWSGAWPRRRATWPPRSPSSRTRTGPRSRRWARRSTRATSAPTPTRAGSSATPWRIARAHGVPDSQMRDIEHGVLLHDIGKIGIPDGILLKPGPPQTGRVEDHAHPPRAGPPARRAHPLPARRRAHRLPPPRALGRHRLPGRAPAARRSRSARASSRSPTPSTP